MRQECIEAVTAAALSIGRKLKDSDFRGIESDVRTQMEQLAKKDRKAFINMTQQERLAEASKIKLAVVSDSTIVNFLSVMATLTHSDSYLLNMDFHRVGYFVNTWKEAVPDANNIKEALEYAKMINKLALVQSMAMKSIRGVTEIGDLDLKILMYLYEAGQYVSRETMDNYFKMVYKKTIITAAVKRLFEKFLIERNPTVRLPEYQITSFGRWMIFKTGIITLTLF